MPHKPASPAKADPAAALSTFVALMTAFGGTQQVLKTRMQNDAEQGLGPLHLRALCLCQRNPGTTPQQLVQSMGRDKGQIARLIRELEERGLLLRTPDERDGRVWRLTATSEGEAKCEWFTALELGVAHDLLGTLSVTDPAQLGKLLATVQAQLDRINTDA